MVKQNQGKKSENIILIGIIIGVLVGFLIGWYTGPHLKNSEVVYQQSTIKYLKKFDKNENNKIEFDEFPSNQKAAIRSLFKEYDQNKDDSLDLKKELKLNNLNSFYRRQIRKSLVENLDEDDKKTFLEIESSFNFLHTMYDIFKLLGDLFLNALKMLIVPLVITSMISGVAALGDVRKLRKIGIYTLVFYAITTALAVLIGIIMVNIIQPGVGTNLVQTMQNSEAAVTKDLSMLDVISGLVHPNIIQAMVELKILPIILFSLIIGAILTTMGEKGKNTIDVIVTFGDAVMKFVMLVMYIAPIGIFGLVAYKVGISGGSEGFGTELKKVAWYVFTVLFALGIHAFFVLPAILYIFAKRSPGSYAYGMMQALLTAFSTASSSATLPTTMECAQYNNKCSRRATSFVSPLGATINMDGTALYESVAAIFIAQAYGIDLSLSAQALIFITATLAAIGAAGIPQAGLVTMVLVLEAVGLPIEGMTLILAIDWFLDRFRTTVNVWGDSVGIAVIDHQVIDKMTKDG